MTTISPEISFPVGVRALLREEAQQRRRIERAIVATLEERGYDEVILPIVDFVDPYRGLVDEKSLKQSYRFTDREGELLAVRSDFTPMVARVVAPTIRRDETLRLFYRGDVVRNEPSRLGVTREYFQIGAELIGDGSVEADIEILTLASTALRAIGLRPIVAYRDASLLNALTDDMSIRSALVSAMRTKRITLLESFEKKLDREAYALLTKLGQGSLAVDDLRRDERTLSIAERLERVATAVGEAGATLFPVLDEIDEEGSYYTGLRFDIYTDLARTPVARGGRYDALYARFGADVAAIGFTLSVDLLELDRVPRASSPAFTREEVSR